MLPRHRECWTFQTIRSYPGAQKTQKTIWRFLHTDDLPQTRHLHQRVSAHPGTSGQARRGVLRETACVYIGNHRQKKR